MRVVVVGGGIGGLSAGLALRSVGVEVRVYEQAAEIGEVGAGVGLFPNSMRILQRLGVADSVTRRAAPINQWWMFTPTDLSCRIKSPAAMARAARWACTVRIWWLR